MKRIPTFLAGIYILGLLSCAPAVWSNYDKESFRSNTKNWASAKNHILSLGGNFDEFCNCYTERCFATFKNLKELQSGTQEVKDKTSKIYSECTNKVAKWTKIETGVVATEGVVITASDGSFTLKSGERFKTPFSCQNRLSEDAKDPIVRDVHKILNGEYKDYKAVRVKVKTPYQKGGELYGVLLFCDVPLGCQTSLVTRSYRIEIPESYVTAALGGRVSCLYEYYGCGPESQLTTWVLWLSDSPF